MARPRRAVIRAAIASNRPAQPRLSVSQNRQAKGNIGVSRARPARPANGRGPQNGGQPQVGAQSGSQVSPGGPTAMPWDSMATADVGGAYRNASDKLAGLQGNWDAEQRTYGIGPGFENNPYSKASLLQRQREIGQRGNLNRAGNQLYAGSTLNRAGGIDRDFSEGRAHLQESYEARRAQVEREELATQHELQSEQERAQAEAIQRAEESAPEPIAAYGAPGGGGGSGGKAKKAKQGGGFKQNKTIGGKGKGK